eukprot:TRINITY_DN8000_c1_g2_i1.p1 TRINITY_DN8000_c1_g2~~TRINITY_DN8000_c1_g2_i1.p1  ORF type:complete len:429 (+),score=68.14 TRINITY_DN8000_c1_g2_i1:1-1287(+)
MASSQTLSLVSLLCIVLTALAVDRDVVCNVRDYGAIGDNFTLDTDAIQTAIDKCPSKIVLIPENFTFYTKPIQLHEGTHLIVNGNIAGLRDVLSWPNSTNKNCSTSPYETPYPEIIQAPQRESLIWSMASSNITISGTGVIDGQGWRWWPYRNKPGDYWHNCRPSLVEFGAKAGNTSTAPILENINVSGVTLKDSPFWTLSARGLRNAVFDRVKVTTSGCGYSQSPNTDGLNIQGENIVVKNSIVHNGDDCVPIFPPSRNITILNMSCTCGNGIVPIIWHTALNYPGFAGNISNVLIDGATFTNTETAVAVKGLQAFDGFISNVTWRNIQLFDVKEAIMFNENGQSSSVQSGRGLSTPRYSNLSVINVTGSAACPGKIVCEPGAYACDGLLMINVTVDTPSKCRDYTCSNAKGIAQGCSPVPCDWNDY